MLQRLVNETTGKRDRTAVRVIVMHRMADVMIAGPALVSILRRGPYLIASVNTALDDSQMIGFQKDLIAQIGSHRSIGVVIDVAALDVIDSFGCCTLRNIAEMAGLRGALTALVGIQPSVAFTMVALGMGSGCIHTALDLGEGLAYLDSQLLYPRRTI